MKARRRLLLVRCLQAKEEKTILLSKETDGDLKMVEETSQEALSRYTDFGIGLFALLKDRLPNGLENVKFYRSLEYQTDDLFAVYDDSICTFSIQLDPDIEVIVLSNQEIRTEIGTWSDNEIEEAFAFIETYLLKII